MKFSTTRPIFLGLLTVGLALTLTPMTQGQAEKVKQKAKDLKKQVEGTAPKTNAPPAKPAPAR